MASQLSNSGEEFASIRDSPLFASNSPPTQGEELSLRAKRSAIQASLREVKEGITAAEKNLESLKTKRDHLESLLEEYSIPLAPIRRVPRDVILHIFQILQPTRPQDIFDLRSGPWSISHVCSPWQAIIHDTPSFWKEIRVDIRSRVPKYATSILFAVFQRTKAADLHIIFKTRSSAPFTSSALESELFLANSKRLLELLCSLSHRWKIFEGVIPLSHWDCFRQVKGMLLRLEFLSLGIIGPTDTIDLNHKDDTFSQAPKLERVFLGYGLMPPPMPLLLSVPELTIRPPGVNFRYSKYIPDTVTKLKLLRNPDESVKAGSAHTSLPKVTSLYADGFTFSHLTLPNLTTLNLFKWYSTDTFIVEVNAFIRRSGLDQPGNSCLTQLTLSPYGVTVSRSPYLSLSIFPHIRRLEINSSSLPAANDQLALVMEPMLKQLILPSSPQLQNVLCLPHLTTLCLNYSKHSCCLTRNLVHQVVLSRSEPPPWFVTQANTEKLQSFSYTDAAYKDLTLLTYDVLTS